VIDQFQHVMVLTSIIIGLAIANLLTGVGAAIDRFSDRESRIRLSVTHATWGGTIFVWLVSFWWWQFRLLELVTTWTMGRYLFIILYAVLLFLLVVVIVPRDWDEVASLDEYFMAKRSWFFGLFFVANVVDVGDSLMKGGWSYFFSNGPVAVGLTMATLPICWIGIRSPDIRIQRGMAVFAFTWQMLVIFNAFNIL
jgi:hypothetical protein